ncbi:MAG: GH92 family glycosyl hydrolase [Ginsengibacter sp.]
MIFKKSILSCLFVSLFILQGFSGDRTPVDYVNPYMGNISHLLVPTFPTIHLPNSMLRVYPERDDYTSDQMKGLPLIVTSHRGRSAFNLSPVQTSSEQDLKKVSLFSYDHESISPYFYQVVLDESQTHIKYAPSHQAALYDIKFTQNKPAYLVFNTIKGTIRVAKNKIYASQELENNTVVYLFAETDQMPDYAGILEEQKGINKNKLSQEGENVAIGLRFSKKQNIRIRYGISFISLEQAEKNLVREINHFDLDKLKEYGRTTWNKALGKIEVNGVNDNEKSVFYTSLYRTYERPVNITEGNRYFSAFDGKIHEAKIPFYTDDWIWDTYRATHPLRILIDSQTESDIINSFIRMAEQMEYFWLPTFPEITGDSRRMNSNHGVATIADAYSKGMRSFDLEKAYTASKNAIREKTLAPWSSKPAGWLDDFYKKNGYIPALAPGEKETVPEVHGFEKRQPVAVTLGTAYDEWCLSQIATMLGKKDEAAFFGKNALNYRHLFNKKTGFFHPKDKDGKFIEPFDYRFSGGQGAREYYGENNAWIYRWDVPHNVADLIQLMGGREQFNKNLNQTFREPLGRSKFEFYAQLPDHTGNVGQFSMANEPSLHIPYLYNFSGKPWMTQKRIHKLMNEWFRNDLMGVPGDEDGGGLSAFVVFSMVGFYPITPGMPMYTIGSPFFESATIHLDGNKTFTVKAENFSSRNKYIQSARLNGKAWNKSWFYHSELQKGGTLILVMGDTPNYEWGSAVKDAPPSFSK